MTPPPAAIIFDLDGVLVDSEQRWNAAKEELVHDAGGRWRPDAAVAMMDMSAPEWADYLHDVYLACARRLRVDPASCLAIEDSSNGLRSAAAARMTVIAVPNPHYPPSAEALALAAATVAVVGQITPRLVDRICAPA